MTTTMDNLKVRLHKRHVLRDILIAPVIASLAIGAYNLVISQVVPIINHYTPVLSSVGHKQLYLDKTSVIFELYAIKDLESMLVPNSVQAEVSYNNVWYEAEFEFLHDKSPNSSRPVNVQDTAKSFGQWEWRAGNMNEAEFVKVSVKHLYNLKTSITVLNGANVETITGDEKTTTIGPIKIRHEKTNNK